MTDSDSGCFGIVGVLERGPLCSLYRMERAFSPALPFAKQISRPKICV